MRNRTVFIAKYQTGGIKLKKKIPRDLSPMRCINYVNSLPGGSFVLPGVKNVEELNENLKYLTQQEKDQDFSSLIEFFRKDTN